MSLLNNTVDFVLVQSLILNCLDTIHSFYSPRFIIKFRVFVPEIARNGNKYKGRCGFHHLRIYLASIEITSLYIR